jgi:hypothetical protein
LQIVSALEKKNAVSYVCFVDLSVHMAKWKQCRRRFRRREGPSLPSLPPRPYWCRRKLNSHRPVQLLPVHDDFEIDAKLLVCFHRNPCFYEYIWKKRFQKTRFKYLIGRQVLRVDVYWDDWKNTHPSEYAFIETIGCRCKSIGNSILQ